MPTIACPRCGSPISFRRVFSPANKPFCTRCGWNLERVEAAVAAKGAVVKLIPLAVAALAIFAAFAAVPTKSPASPMFFLFPLVFGVVLLLPIWGFYSTRKQIAAAKFSVNPDLAQARLPPDPSLQQLQALSRPRRVRFRFGGNMTIGAAALLVMVTFALVGFFLTASATRNAPHPRDSFPALIPILSVVLVFLILVIIPFFRAKRDLPLLRDGEFAFGRVTSQQTIQQGKANYSQIHYEFKTGSGQLVQNSSRDISNSVFEDMTIPVFYDPVDPSKNITPCSTYLQISTNPF